MSVVAGVDFGTLSVRVSIFDSTRGRLGAGTADYPLVRKKEDPDHATQSHADHMRALTEAMRRAPTAKGEMFVINLSGRGDKDTDIYRENLKELDDTQQGDDQNQPAI